MESLQKPERHTWISKPINVGDFVRSNGSPIADELTPVPSGSSLIANPLDDLKRSTQINDTKRKPQSKQSREPDPDRIEEPQAILTVEVISIPPGKRPVNKCKPQQELQLLSSQKLTELRDAIKCPTDLAMVGQVEARELYPSGFFYIADCFYNDMRKEQCKDLSQVIRDWATEKDRGIGQMSVAKMEDYNFDDLIIRLGQPYLYRHQGDCDHWIIFSRIRMMDTSDMRSRMAYPKVVGGPKYLRLRCQMCRLNVPRYYTQGDSRLPYVQYFFCDSCYKVFYNDEQSKPADVVTVNYIDPAIVS